MKAVVCRTFGGPEVLEVGEVDDPVAGQGELLVEVKACSVNFPDLLMIQDLYQFKPGLPFVPGSELGGIVRDLGPGVEGFDVGDRVIGSSMLAGGLAERATVLASTALTVPDDASFADLAGFLYAYGTAHYALRGRADLQPGQTVLVLGAAGAVGLAAVDVAHLMGARVIAAASTDEKLELCRRHGADDTINYSTEDLKARAKELTHGQGANVIYDPVGGAYSEQALRAIAWEGKFLVIGFANGEIPRIPLNLTLLKGCDIVGVFWANFVATEPEKNRQYREELFAWYREGKLVPETSCLYPFDRAADAFADMAARRAMGKVVVTVG